MDQGILPERPSKVTLALCMLYISLGIGVITVLLTWWRTGSPGLIPSWLVNILIMIISFHFQAVTGTVRWMWHGGLLIVPIVPIAVWLYYMIGTGKNWARITLLVFVICESLDFLLLLPGSALGPCRFSLSAVPTSSHLLQVVLKIIAVTLLFGRTSSVWFKAMRVHLERPRVQSIGLITKIAVASLGLVIASAIYYEAIEVRPLKALNEAVRKNDVGQVRELLKKGANFNLEDEYGYPILVRLAELGRLEMVKLILDHGADVDAKAKNGQTALNAASCEGRLDVVRLLLAKGADINAEDSSGWTPLICACWKGKIDVAKLLLDKGADINATANNGETALSKALGADLNVGDRLLGKGARSNAKDKLGKTWLLNGSCGGNLKVVKLLLGRGADINVKGGRGCTPLIWASGTGQHDLVKLLLEKKADIDARDDSGETALMKACVGGHVNVLRLLLDNGADTNVTDMQGRTPLMEASKIGRTDLVELLKAHGARE